MTPPVPLIEVANVSKQYVALRPLRVAQFVVRPGEQFVLSGFDAIAAEMLIHLITGAALPDEGTIRIAGRDTRDIATDTEWLTSLDRFGLVSERAVLIDQLPIAANMALPLTLTIDPMSPETRAKVDELAEEVGLAHERLPQPAGTLTATERTRVHMARAIAPGPQVLLLEHPTAKIDAAADRASIGATVARLAQSRGLAWVAMSEDQEFVRASGGIELRLTPATGALSKRGFLSRLFTASRSRRTPPADRR